MCTSFDGTSTEETRHHEHEKMAQGKTNLQQRAAMFDAKTKS